MSRALTVIEATLVYDVLTEECAAPEGLREEFLYYETHVWPTEFRFQGSLGFGGKFWNGTGGWRVSCYREDSTPARDQAIARANERLAALRLRLTDLPVEAKS